MDGRLIVLNVLGVLTAVVVIAAICYAFYLRRRQKPDGVIEVVVHTEQQPQPRHRRHLQHGPARGNPLADYPIAPRLLPIVEGVPVPDVQSNPPAGHSGSPAAAKPAIPLRRGDTGSALYDGTWFACRVYRVDHNAATLDVQWASDQSYTAGLPIASFHPDHRSPQQQGGSPGEGAAGGRQRQRLEATPFPPRQQRRRSRIPRRPQPQQGGGGGV